MRRQEDIEWSLFLSVEDGDVDKVRYLLDRGVPVNGRGGGTTILRVAAGRGNEQIVRLLVERGAQLDLAGEDCWTPLQDAISHGHSGIARFLLANGRKSKRQAMGWLDTTAHDGGNWRRGNDRIALGQWSRFTCTE
jgi:ankyrin repeat protein